MKRMKRKALLSFVSVAALAIGVGLTVLNSAPLETANAETTHTEEVFMVNGASIRYNEPAGIRFTGYVKDDGDLSDNTVGFKITVNGVEKEFSTATIEGAAWQWAESDVEGYRKFQVAIKNIPEAQYATEMTAQAYVDHYTSAEIVTRSIAGVANAALAADSLEEKLNPTKITALEEYINDAAVSLPFDATDVAISGDFLMWDAVENAKGYLVQFGDEVKNIPTNGAETYSVNLTEFETEKGSLIMFPYGDGTAYTYAATPYATVYDTNKFTVTFDTDGGSKIVSVQVEPGTTMAEFYKQKYIPADSGFVFDYWLHNGERVDETDVITDDMTLVARYKRVDGYAVEESPVNGDFYQAFLAIPTDVAEGESVLITMDIFLTGKIVSKGVDTADEYYNEWATSSIRWVDSVWTTDGGEVKNSAEAVSFNTLRANEGNWVTVSFVATVRNFSVLKTGTGWADVEMGNGNAVYLYAANFKSAASFNYKNVQVSATTSMPAGTQKTNPDQYYQSAIGLPTELAAGTFAKVEMDVMVTGTVDDYSYIRWVDTVWTTAGGEVNNAPAIADYATMSAHAGEWIHVEFYATVRDFDVLRLNSAYPTIDVSETGTGVFLVAESFLSSNTFIYKNVAITADEAAVGKAMPVGTQKTANPNNYYQAFAGIPTDMPVGSTVAVEMDVYITGAYDQYSDGIKWVDTVWSTSGGEVNAAPTIVNYATINENAGEWIHVVFTATVRNFGVLRSGTEYATMDTSEYGNAVYLFAKGFKSEASFNYKNVSISGAMPTGTQKTSPDKYYQSVMGIHADYPVGASVTVGMDVLVTGSFDSCSYISWVDTVWTTAGGEINNAPIIVNSATMTENEGQWIHVTFEATVRDFDVLRMNSAYPTMDVSGAGTGVFLVAANFTSADSFIYKNVTMKATLSVPDGVKKSNGYYQAFVGLSTDYEVGTTVAVGMDIYVTGTVDTAYSATEIRWVDSVWTTDGGEVNANPVMLSNAQLIAGAGQWIHVEFEATVRNFSVLRMDSSFTTMDVSAYGNAVYIMSKNFKSASSFSYKNVTIKLPGEEEPEEPEVPVIEGVAMPDATQKTTPDKYYQSAVGISTDLPAGTFVKVDMDVYVTGTIDEYSYISWISSVWGDNAVEKETKIATYAEMSANAGQWMHLEFYAYVRELDLLRRDASYPTIDVSAAGTGVFIFAANFTSAATFHYDNVVISADKADVGVAMTNGTEKTSNANGYHQAFIGLSTDYEVGTFVRVDMEIFITGTADSNTSIQWVDTVWTTSGGEVNAAPTIVSYETMSANAGKWIHVTFDAFIKDYDVLRTGTEYATMDVSEYGNAVFLFAKNFKSEASFNYKNVTVTAYDAMPEGTQKTSNANGYYQAFVGLPVSVPVGTEVNVSMEVYVTGAYDQYLGGIKWVDTVWGDNAPNSAPTLVSYTTISEQAGKWITVSFEATVRNFSVLCSSNEYALVDLSQYGNAVYLFAKDFKSAASFYYRNVVITADGVDVAVKDDYTPEVYTSNGKNITDYSIVVSDTASKSTQYAATILQARLRDALGVDLAVITDATEEQPFEIILGNTNRSACSVIDFSLLGSEEFRVQNVGYDLVIAGNERGVLYGVYAYLEALGYRFYTVDVEKIPEAEDIFVPASIELTWTPTFEYRETMYEMTWDEEWAVSQRVNSDFLRGDLKADSQYGGFVGYVGGNSWTVHTLWRLLPESEFSANPTYFAELNGERKVKDSDEHYTQPCLSSEGAYQLILKNALAVIASDRKANIISISENDGGDYCTCSACQASYAQYGVSGTFFRFINRIAGDIAKVYPDVYVDTLSYAMSKEVPTGITFADNVIVRVCPNMCNQCTDAAKCATLAADQQRIRAFTDICENVYVWFYPVNHGHYLVSMPNYEQMRSQVRFFALAGVKGVYAEGYPMENTEFGELKAYLMAKLLQNPMMSKAEYEYHLNDFLHGYYGEAAEYIAEYIALTEEMMDANIAKNGHYTEKYYTVENNFDFAWDSSTNTYDMTYINQINVLWNKALASVEGEEYDHVRKSMMHWTYIELYNTMDNRYKYGTAEEKAELVARNEALYNDFKYYGITKIYGSSHELQTVTDFTKSPHRDKGNWFNQRTTLEEALGDIFGV